MTTTPFLSQATMLLRFTSQDMLNSALIDVSTGQVAYTIMTTVVPPELNKPEESNTSAIESRATSIKDASGNIVVSISWTGRRPDITLFNKKIGGLTDLFGSSTVRFMPKVMVVPTRFDTEYIWTATPNSLKLIDYDTETIKGTFHQNVIRFPCSFQLRFNPAFNSLPSPSSIWSRTNLKSDTYREPTLIYSSSSDISSASSDDASFNPANPAPPNGRRSAHFVPTHMPCVGSNYLEFCHHPLAHDVEIILSFLMMEIVRRGRFGLVPYMFQKPKMLEEARNIMMRKLRRNTV